MSESDKLLSRTNFVDYGASNFNKEKTETTPLLVEEDRMDDTKIGISQQTLVSTTGEASKFPQYLGALIATIGGFISGTCLAWSSPTEKLLTTGNEYGFPVDSYDFSWIGSLMAVGALAGAPIVGYLVDLVGRKMTLLILIVPAVIGWALIVWAESVTMFCIGRFISGIAGGGYTIVVPLYTNEYSETNIRGTLGTYFQLQINLGILFTYLFGSFLSVFWLSLVCGIVPLVYGGMMMFLPESPIFYLKMKKEKEARSALQFYRGKHYDVEPELTAMQRNIEAIESERIPMVKAFATTAAKRGLVIGLGIMIFQQLSGINSVIFYSNSIFTDAGSKISSDVETIIVGVVAVVFTYISTLIIDKVGRRPLLLLSDLFMALCTFVLGLYFYLKTQTSFDVATISFIPIVAVCVFIIVFSLGYGPIPWMFMSEVFPRQITGYACSLASMTNWIFVFLVTRFFSDVSAAIGTYGSFWLFTAISAIGTVFVYFLVPETKGKTVEEVQIELGGR